MRRKKLILMAVVLFMMAVLSAPVIAADQTVEDAVNNYFADLPSDNSMIGEEDFVEMVKDGEDVFVLDIRQPDAYEEGHIKGAVNLPWGSGAIADNLDKLPGDQTIYIYCYTGQTANQVNALLNIAGFDAKSVTLGWDLGISKVDGYEDAVETSENELGEETDYTIEPEIKTALEDYLYGLEDVKDTTYKNYMISEEMLKTAIDSESDMMILSIRQRSDFADGHIPDAANIPWEAGMNEYFGQLPEDEKIVVYCYTGQTAGQTVAGLRLLGYDAVSLRGGFGTPANEPQGWSNQDYEVVE
ncbi:MAG: rhodanese-like domain-containing protein [Bacillota bacterium]